MPAQGEGREPAENRAGDMAISARDLVKDFDSFRAVAGVSFEVAADARAAFLRGGRGGELHRDGRQAEGGGHEAV